ncbi:hypothetical protein SO694_0000468 [Aureococcus anophagefferens]|uniref:Uncharacterized protein n=1 Tax=Aureococcus anophagefferens TaxID=44056 RepID=A0ABR1G9Q4_AURAN
MAVATCAPFLVLLLVPLAASVRWSDLQEQLCEDTLSLLVAGGSRAARGLLFVLDHGAELGALDDAWDVEDVSRDGALAAQRYCASYGKGWNERLFEAAPRSVLAAARRAASRRRPAPPATCPAELCANADAASQVAAIALEAAALGAAATAAEQALTSASSSSSTLLAPRVPAPRAAQPRRRQRLRRGARGSVPPLPRGAAPGLVARVVALFAFR